MAENFNIFQNHRVVKLIMSSPDPSTQERIGGGVRNFDSAVGNGEKQNAVSSGTYAKSRKHLRQIHAECSHEKSPFELWQQASC